MQEQLCHQRTLNLKIEDELIIDVDQNNNGPIIWNPA